MLAETKCCQVANEGCTYAQLAPSLAISYSSHNPTPSRRQLGVDVVGVEVLPERWHWRWLVAPAVGMRSMMCKIPRRKWTQERLGDHLMGSVPSVGMVPIGLEGATGIEAAHPSRSIDDLQKPKGHPNYK